MLANIPPALMLLIGQYGIIVFGAAYTVMMVALAPDMWLVTGKLWLAKTAVVAILAFAFWWWFSFILLGAPS